MKRVFIAVMVLVACLSKPLTGLAGIEKSIDFEVDNDLLMAGEFQLAAKLIDFQQLQNSRIALLDTERMFKADGVYVAVKYAVLAPIGVENLSLETLIAREFMQKLQPSAEIRDTELSYVKELTLNLGLGPIAIKEETSRLVIGAYAFEDSTQIGVLQEAEAYDLLQLDPQLSMPAIIARSTSTTEPGFLNTLSDAVILNAYYPTNDDSKTLVVGYLLGKLGVEVNGAVLSLSRGVIERAIRSQITETIDAFKTLDKGDF